VSGFDVRLVPAEATQALRHRVLRPGQPVATVRWPGHDDPAAATYALHLDGEPVATVTVRPEPCPWRPDEPAPWRLRGMATDDGRQGQGLGRLVLDAAVAHVRAAGATVVWCNARVAARTFYERAGFAVEGPTFPIDGAGPHHPMALAL
jgi:GNAT superfamily N-acetyltransferase